MLVVVALWLVGLSALTAQTLPIHVRVVDAAGLPVAGATITVSGGVMPRAVTDAMGRAEIPLPAGAKLQASTSGMRSGAVPVLGSGADVLLTLRPAEIAQAVTVTATRSAEVPGSYAQTIDALGPEALGNYPALTLDETLRQHAGFELFRRAGSRIANPTSEGVSLRGLGSTAASRTLVLADSVPLNDAFGGWIHWNELPPESVAAVTIATGGGSDLYGSSALGGVIDLVPAEPVRSLGELDVSGAGQGTSDFSGRVDGGAGPWLGTVAGQSLRTTGYIPVNRASAGPIDTPAGVQFQNGHSELDRRAARSRQRSFVAANLLNEARNNGTELTTNGTRLWRYLGGEDWAGGSRTTGRVRFFGSDEGYRQSFSAIPASRATEILTRRQRVRTQELGASADAAVHVGSVAFIGGADVRDLRANDAETPISPGKVTGLQDTTARQRFAGGFGEALGSWARWSAAGSLRVDHAANLDTVQRTNGTGAALPDRAEVVVSPRIGVVRQLNSSFSLRAAGFRAFRTPTMNELYRQGQVGQEITQANPLLLSERATGWEAGLDGGTAGGRFTSLATYFWTEINRPVSAVLLSQTASSVLDRRENLGQLRSQGVELKGEARLSGAVFASVAYQFADATITRFSAQPVLVGNRLPEVPRHSVTAQVRGGSSRWGEYTLALRRSGMVFDDTANTLVLRGFFQADLAGERTVGGHLTAFATVQNLLNHRADVSRTPVLTLGSGILAQAGVRVRWGGGS